MWDVSIRSLLRLAFRRLLNPGCLSPVSVPLTPGRDGEHGGPAPTDTSSVGAGPDVASPAEAAGFLRWSR